MFKSTLAINFHISNRRLRIIFLAIVVFNFLLLGGTTLHNTFILVEKKAVIELFYRQFNLALENVIAAWYSSMLLLSIALMAGVCYIADMKRFQKRNERILSIGWLGLCFIFTLLSFDEIGSFHEIVNQLAIFKSAGFGEDPGLNAFYGLVGIVGLFMVLFFWLKFKRSLWAFLFAVAGAMLFLSHPVQEAYEWHLAGTSANPDAWHRPNILVLIEEGSEIFGSFCFLLSFTIYSVFATSSSKNYVLKDGINLKFSIRNTKLLAALGVFIGGLGFVMLLLKWNPIVFEVMDEGIPRNWFPSAISFIAASVTLYLYHNFKQQGLPKKNIFLWSAVAFLIASAYFGSNMYANNLLQEANLLKTAQGIQLLTNILVGIIIISRIKNFASLCGVGIYLLLSFATFRADELNAPVIAYVSSSCLLLTLVLLYLQIQQQKEGVPGKNVNAKILDSKGIRIN